MDETLERRYRELFRAYGEPGARYLPELKSRLADRLGRAPAPLRADAMLFLLVNLDQMAVRACFEPTEDLRNARALGEPPAGRDAAELVERTLDLVFEHLHPAEREPVSAHAVMRAIDRGWQQIGVLWGWA